MGVVRLMKAKDFEVEKLKLKRSSISLLLNSLATNPRDEAEQEWNYGRWWSRTLIAAPGCFYSVGTIRLTAGKGIS